MEPREVASRWLAEIDAFAKGGRIPQPTPRRDRVSGLQMLADSRAGLVAFYAGRFESVAAASEELARVVFARGGDPRPFVAIAGAIRDGVAPTMVDLIAGRLVAEAIRDGASVGDSVETPHQQHAAASTAEHEEEPPQKKRNPGPAHYSPLMLEKIEDQPTKYLAYTLAQWVQEFDNATCAATISRTDAWREKIPAARQKWARMLAGKSELVDYSDLHYTE